MQEEIYLKVGDKAVYPGHGVGQVTSVEEKEIQGFQQTFYSIKILESGTKIMVPESQIKKRGVRPTVNKKEAQKVIDMLFERKTCKKSHEKNWQKRHQSYMDKIKTGSIYNIAEVITDLNSISKAKELSHGEKKIMDKAEYMLVSELSLTMDTEKVHDSLLSIKK